jgi:Protein of unknown function (DUF1566)
MKKIGSKLRCLRAVTLIIVGGLFAGTTAASASNPACGIPFLFLPAENLLATGVTSGIIAGEDGDPACGLPLSYSDLGDGTIFDRNSLLTWEKKDNSGDKDDLHNVENEYPWEGTCSASSTDCGTDVDCPAGQTCLATDGQGTGLTIFGFVAQLNATKFGGHRDWRVPNIRELDAIVDYGAGPPGVPQVAPAFDEAHCASACTDLTSPACSCTAITARYWSSTTYQLNRFLAWDVFFENGGDEATSKSLLYHVRAVRSGL